MRRWCRLFLVLVVPALVVLCAASEAAVADKRVALVIGNRDYQHADQLANPVTDARRLRDTLARLGFEIVYGENLGKQALERTIGRFADVAQDSDVALVYFAGHGATFGEVPYVVPVDARFSSLEEMPYELVPVETLIGELRRAKGVRIAILDACRDNSAERELKRVAVRGGAITRGLARITNPDGLILAYATQYLSTAADGDPNGDSPFTAALLNNIATPGLDVKELFFKVGSEVIASTKGLQRPEISVSFYDSYALVPAGPSAAASPSAPSPSQDQANVAEFRDFELADKVGTIEAWDWFLRQHSQGFYADLAKAQRLKLAAAQAPASASPSQTAPNPQPTLRPAEPKGTVAIATPTTSPKPDAPPKPPVTAPDPITIARALQTELKRVGCYPGPADGSWNAGSSQALASFNKYAGTALDAKLASVDSLDAVKARATRVCPPICGKNERADGESCVPITCDAGFVLSAEGECQRGKDRPKDVVRRLTPSPPPAAHAKHGGKCFAFEGRQYCE